MSKWTEFRDASRASWAKLGPETKIFIAGCIVGFAIPRLLVWLAS